MLALINNKIEKTFIILSVLMLTYNKFLTIVSSVMLVEIYLCTILFKELMSIKLYRIILVNLNK
jgi:hypothetical protein